MGDVKAVSADRSVISNWASTYSATPQQFCLPKTVEEVQTIVRQTTAAGKVLRVVGSAHSPNDCAMSNEVMISLDRLNKVILIDVEHRLVKVQAGIKLYQLHEILDAHGLAFDNLGSISEQSIAGLISTGTHGTGLEKQTIHTCVQELQIVLASGDLMVASRKQNSGKLTIHTTSSPWQCAHSRYSVKHNENYADNYDLRISVRLNWARSAAQKREGNCSTQTK